MMIKNFFFVLFFLLLSQVTIAQNPKYIQEVESILDSAYQKATEAKWEESATFSHKALRESKRYKYEKGESWSYFYLGQGLFELAKYKESLKSLNSAEQSQYAATDAFLLVEIYRVRSRVYGSMRLFQPSIQEQKKGLKIIPEIKRSKEDKNFLTALAYENLANTYKRAAETDSAFYYMKKEETLLESMDESFVHTNLLSLYPQIGNYFSESGNYDEAERYFIKTLELSEKYNNYTFRAYNFMKWGDMMLKQQDTDKALHYYTLALQSNIKTHRETELAEIYSKLAVVYQKKGDAVAADDFQIKALRLQDQFKQQQLNSSEFVLDTLVSEKVQEQKSIYRMYMIWILLMGIVLISALSALILSIIKKKRKTVLKLEDKEIMIDRLEKKGLSGSD